MIHPLKKVFITQNWGDNPDDYARFGLKGHNGTDYRLFDKNGNRATTAEVFAPHSGTIIETGWDANGYGNYIKLENGQEGSILAHLKEFKKSVGDGVNEGDLIAIANNTGNSTGAHLHWGYYPIPRYRDNGYSGTIDQLKILNPPVPTPIKFTDQTIIPVGEDWGNMELQAVRSTLNDQKRDLGICERASDRLQEDLAEALGTIKELEGEAEVYMSNIKELYIEIEKLEKKWKDHKCEAPVFTKKLSKLFYELAVALEGK